MSDELKFFKLSYSGNFEEIESENVYEIFNIYDIITIYSAVKKTMYIWIGRRAVQSLKRHIASIRHTFAKERPDLIILRNITIEDNSESDDFFVFTKLERAKLKKFVQEQETRLMPVISEINRLKNKADRLFIQGKFEQAIQTSKIVQELAQQIDDESLFNDQASFIEESKIKNKAKRILTEIEEEANLIRKKVKKLNQDQKILEIDHHINNFIKKYEEFNVKNLPFVQDLLSIQQDISVETQSKKESLIGRLKDFDIKFNAYLRQNYLIKAESLIEQANALLNKLQNHKLTLKWQKYDEELKYNKEKWKENIQLEVAKIIKYLEERKINKSLELLDQIIQKLGKMKIS